MTLMQPLPLSVGAKRLISSLQAANRHKAAGGQAFHVASLGAGFYFAYEQLRNAAEYRERHLLLRSAIERYLAREVSLHQVESMAADLITELTQAGYLKNDTVPVAVITQIDELIARCGNVFDALTGKHINGQTAGKWLYQYASVAIENLLALNPKTAVIMQFAYEHYLASVDAKATVKSTSDDPHYRIALYCAVHRALFKSNLATIRYYCLTASLGPLEHQTSEHLVQLNQLIDELYQAPMANHLVRIITRYGAPCALSTKSSSTPRIRPRC
jgi:hypothetical protein